MARWWKMSWARILKREFEELSVINYTKLNVIQQDIADLFQNNKLTIQEAGIILNGMKNKEMVNREIAVRYYKKDNEVLLNAEKLVISDNKVVENE